jgi:hypothetical protein
MRDCPRAPHPAPDQGYLRSEVFNTLSELLSRKAGNVRALSDVGIPAPVVGGIVGEPVVEHERLDRISPSEFSYTCRSVFWQIAPVNEYPEISDFLRKHLN